MLVDEVQITVKAGDGGDGRVSFLHEKFRPKGGPDGGKGGNGGDVYLEGVEDIGALSRYRYQKSFSAGNGEIGGKNKKTGVNGADLLLKVPIGCVLKDLETNEIWEIKEIGKEILIAKAGKGGRGNWSFRSATNQTPQEYKLGTAGEQRELFLELRLIADVGFIGLPSVGKTSLLNELTNAGAKVAPYHFTTLEPNLGVMDGLILADLPGLIQGAHTGRGLGIKFLKHIKRTKVLVHCIGVESDSPMADYEIIRKELGEYDKELLEKPEIILLTKSDLVSKDILKEKISAFAPPIRRAMADKENLKHTKKEILPVSIHDYDSLEKLKEKIENIVM